jgi:hypothetical protein
LALSCTLLSGDAFGVGGTGLVVPPDEVVELAVSRRSGT